MAANEPQVYAVGDLKDKSLINQKKLNMKIEIKIIRETANSIKPDVSGSVNVRRHSLAEDFGSRLPDVQRWWIRIPATILLTPVCFVGVLIAGVFEAVGKTAKFFYECCSGVEN